MTIHEIASREGMIAPTIKKNVAREGNIRITALNTIFFLESGKRVYRPYWVVNLKTGAKSLKKAPVRYYRPQD
jgi:hypothetical protein